MRFNVLKELYLSKLDRLVHITSKNPQIIFQQDRAFRELLHEFRLLQNSITKKKMCALCFTKLKLKDLTHEQKVTLYTSGLCPKCDSIDDNKSILSFVKKSVEN